MKALRIWLFIGLIMILIQIIVGGITRLTGSGLSITKWEIITGTIPPLTQDAWEKEFDLYKSTPQYQKINEGMQIAEFKFIYFWEYIHRLWARLMGIIFIIPFIFFYRKGIIDRLLFKRLIFLVLLAGLTASFGWIMVASGLIERPWVNAYKLTLHLSIAISTLIYLLWIWSKIAFPYFKFEISYKTKSLSIFLLILVCAQIILGGILSGIKGSMVYPTWPLIDNSFIPKILLDKSQWNYYNFTLYEKSPFLPAFTQFLHRMNGYFIYIIGVFFGFSILKMGNTKNWVFSFLILLNLQVILGIYTLINSIGLIPLVPASLHQLIGIGLLMLLCFFIFKTSAKDGSILRI